MQTAESQLDTHVLKLGDFQHTNLGGLKVV